MDVSIQYIHIYETSSIIKNICINRVDFMKHSISFTELTMNFLIHVSKIQIIVFPFVNGLVFHSIELCFTPTKTHKV